MSRDVTSGHFGVTKTVARIKERFMWKGILRDVKSMVRFLLSIFCSLTRAACSTCSSTGYYRSSGMVSGVEKLVLGERRFNPPAESQSESLSC